jgi:phosphoribosylamine--glycine ligase/phosphoribosylaminoimidazole synthetase
MRVIIIGSGGREQALAWACRRHGHGAEILVNPTDDELSAADLIIPGPEAALVAGIAERCATLGVPCFGPTVENARLESSKGFSRDLASQLGIPGPTWARFEIGQIDEALTWWRHLGRPIVVKQDGLAAGKGVHLPDDDDTTIETISTVGGLGPFVLEERLTGPECSLLALCDGRTAIALPVAQDHKRIGEGDTGPNTGGMGAYAPAPIPHDPSDLLATFIDPILRHLEASGSPYIGVLYAGLMLTHDGPRLIEYNCRFGDPEAQAILPLVATDLAQLLLIASTGGFGEATDRLVQTVDGAACTVVAAAPGYPESPELGARIISTTFTDVAIAGPSLDDDNSVLFPAAVSADGYVTGGRVLSVTGIGPDLAEARLRAYDALAGIAFDGMQLRRDIGWRAPGAVLRSYADTGVDIDEGNRAVEAMRDAVSRTHGPSVLRGVGAFGGVIDLSAAAGMVEPVLVASTDGVGTKVELAARLGSVRGIGADIVNHCIDDVLVQSARPLFFLDYIAASHLDADVVADVVTGMAEACEAAGCALLGGETAEMPGVYEIGAFDVAGTLIGIAERSRLLPHADLNEGDVLIGIASSGPHTNGYSFLRRLFQWFPMDAIPAGFDRPLGETLLEPHRSYLPLLGPLLDGPYGTKVKALAHITGGGLPENLPRVLPDGLAARIQLGSWPISPLFELVQTLTPGVSEHERHRMLNMGIGMVIVCAAEDADELAEEIGEQTWRIGELVGRVNGEAVELIAR